MILQRLRKETKPFHDSLEVKMDILSSQKTLEDYKILLEKFYGFYRPLENMITSTMPELNLSDIDWPSRVKIPLLLKDLAALGHSAESIHLLPVCDALPSIESTLECLGVCYVFEGQTLGGQLLSKHFQSRFGIDAETGCSFFASYGPLVGNKWKDFCTTLVGRSETPAQQDTVVHAAANAFQTFETWVGFD